MHTVTEPFHSPHKNAFDPLFIYIHILQETIVSQSRVYHFQKMPRSIKKGRKAN